MLNPGRIVLASSLWLSLSCGQTQSSEPHAGASAGAPSAAAGSAGSSAGSTAGSTASGAAGSTPTEEGGADQGSAAAGGGGSGGAAEAGMAAAAGDADVSEVQMILDTYHSYAPQTPAPVNVSGYIFALCRLPTLRETEFEASIHGDGRYLQDWANELAGQGLAMQGEPEFPAGAVIVKEKYAGPQTAPADLVAIAMMIKRAAGFDPAHGDWDYAYYEPALGVVQTAEQTAYCAQCHSAAAATDYVYVEGLKP